MSCELVPKTKNLMVGWGCCQCRSYNGLQRDACNHCGHVCCFDKPKPEEYGLCNLCGVPLDGVGKMWTAAGKLLQHVGHDPKNIA